MMKIIGFVFVVFLLVVLEFSVRGDLLDPVYFPAPSAVIVELSASLWGSTELWKHIITTIIRSLVGFTLAMSISLPVGLWMGRSKWAFAMLEPLVDMLRPMPSAAIIPIAILLCGIENEMKILVICFGAIWPTIISTIDGIRGIDTMLLDTGKIMQLTNRQMLFKIMVPAASPVIATGMRISLAIALILSVTSEMIAGSNGLGYFILDAERGFAFKKMYAGIVVLGAIGFASSRIFGVLERRILFWHYIPRNSNP